LQALSASVRLKVLSPATHIERHRFINNFIIFYTPTFGKWQSGISWPF